MSNRVWSVIVFTLLVCIPLGILCAVYMSKYPGAFSRFVRMVAEAMTELRR